MSREARLLFLLLKLGVLFVVIIGIFVLSVYLGIFGPIPGKPELSRIRNHSASLVLSHDSKLIGKYFLQNRMTIEQDSISANVKNALIATEDSRFFRHSGLDFISLGRVMLKSLALGKREQGGGSTISQQLARNLYPRRDFGRFTMPVNKVREIFISARLEKVYSKDEILALYLNTVPFGDNIFGIEVAARQFFGQPSSTLTPPEAATLIGMLAANTSYNPRVNPERSLQRRNIVLERMVDQGFLEQEEAEGYMAEPIKLNYSRLDYNSGPAPYFIEYIRPKIQDVLDEEYPGEYNIYTDGLVITTSLDSALQQYANEAVDDRMAVLQKEFNSQWAGRDPWSGNPDLLWNSIKASEVYQDYLQGGLSPDEAVDEMRKARETKIFDPVEGNSAMRKISPLDSLKLSITTLQPGFLAMDPHNGHLLAWVGGRNFEFFRFDHIISHRQVGSTFKPVLYAAAIQQGISPCEFISNEVRTFTEYQDWAPENSDGNHEGWYSVKGGLINSVNTISAELIHRTGIIPVIEQARRMGIESEIPTVPSIALGTADLSLMEMIRAYSSFANLGVPAQPVSILKIEDWEGNLLWSLKEPEPADSAFSYVTARTMVEIMKGVVERGTGRSLRSVYGIRGEIAGKTGTTQDNADGWFIGYNPAIVAGAWVGADNPAIHFRTTALGQGAHTSLPIFAGFMQKIGDDPHFREITRAGFPALSDSLSASLHCRDFSLDNPSPGLIGRIIEGIFFKDTTKVDGDRKMEKKEIQKEQEEEGLFEKIKKLFKKKKSE